MRAFADIRQSWGLKKFLASELGTLYFVPATGSPGSRRVIVHHFDRALSPSLARPYADLIVATARWVRQRPELDELIRVLEPEEVGLDFVARKHLTYYNSLDIYDLPDAGVEEPPELDEVQRRLRVATAEPTGERDAVIGRILVRSLEPTGKTYFDEIEGRFIVVEPKLTREDVESWARLTALPG